MIHCDAVCVTVAQGVELMVAARAAGLHDCTQRHRQSETHLPSQFQADLWLVLARAHRAAGRWSGFFVFLSSLGLGERGWYPISENDLRMIGSCAMAASSYALLHTQQIQVMVAGPPR